MTIRIALIGLGKIALDEHWPAIRDNGDFGLVATAGGRGIPPPGIARFANHGELLAEMVGKLDAVAICTPPGPRHAIARDCLNAGFDVLLEKPPTATIGALEDLTSIAQANGRTLFAAWHSQHAPAVVPAVATLKGKRVRWIDVTWCEDVRRWHPGQDWVFGAGGFGVLDPGINALSILSRVIDHPLLVAKARFITPANRKAPITAEINLDTPQGRVWLDWRAKENERSIRIETEDGCVIEIGDGGIALAIDGIDQKIARTPEYPALYARFAELIASRTSDIDAAPLRLVADAFLVGVQEATEAFDWA